MKTLLAEALNLMQTEGLTPDQAAARVGASDDSRRVKLVSLLEIAQRVSMAERPLIREEVVEETRRKLLDKGKRRQGTK